MLLDFRAALLVMGLLLCVLGAAMIAPLLADLSARNPDWRAFAESAAVTLFAGGALALANWGRVESMTRRSAFLLTAGAWILLSAFAAAPFYYAGLDLSVADAVFESVSGLTTTGATVLTGLDSMAPGILLWRAILQWIGGIGIIVMALALLPMMRVGGMQLFRLESSDTEDKLLPRATHIAGAIAGLYLTLTVLCALAYRATGMSAFDAATHAMTTLSTGGFSTSDRSMGAFAEGGADIVATVFMLMGSLPFGLYVLAVRGRAGRLFQDSQVRLLLAILAFTTLALTLYLWIRDVHEPVEGVRLAAFNVVSIISTTGYATADYTLWGPAASGVFFGLLFLGGCAGSTSGGLKTFRLHIGGLALRSYVLSIARPHATHRPHYNGQPVSDDEMSAVLSFLFLFLACFTLVAVYLSAIGLDVVTAISAAATCIANVGPGLGAMIGPAGTFQQLPDSAKWALDIAMIAGRLEVVTLLVVLTPGFWR